MRTTAARCASDVRWSWPSRLRQRFEDYNAEFTRITRRAARHFMARDWPAARADAVQRIELYELHVSYAIEAVRQRARRRDS